MCSICHQYPCNPSCPNADEPPVADYCAHCGGEIYEGEDYKEYGDKMFHDDCWYHGASDCIKKESEFIAADENSPVKQIAICEYCKEPIMSDEDRRKFNGAWYHSDCLLDNATDILDEDVTSGTAEASYYELDYDPADKYDF